VSLSSLIQLFMLIQHPLQGARIILLTRTDQRYEGTVLSTSGEGDTTGVTLKDVKELSNPGANIKDQFFIASTNIKSWDKWPADARNQNGEGEFLCLRL
jgi:hypothetical protein